MRWGESHVGEWRRRRKVGSTWRERAILEQGPEGRIGRREGGERRLLAIWRIRGEVYARELLHRRGMRVVVRHDARWRKWVVHEIISRIATELPGLMQAARDSAPQPITSCVAVARGRGRLSLFTCSESVPGNHP